MQQGFITAGNKKYAITDEFLKANDPADLETELSGEDTAKLKAAELLNDNIKKITAPPSQSQTPYFGKQQPADPTDGRASNNLDETSQIFVETNATPAEFGFDGYDDDFYRTAEGYIMPNPT